MARAFLLFLILFYFVPLAISPAGHTLEFSLLSASVLLSGLLGLFFPLAIQSRRCHGIVRLSRSSSLDVGPRILFFLFFIYGAAKLPSFMETFGQLLNGSSILVIMQEKSVERYSDNGESFGALFNMGTAVLYAISSSILHFLLGPANSARLKSIAAILFFLALFIEVLDGSRTRVLLCAVFLSVEVLILGNHRLGSMRLSKFISHFLLSVLFLLLVFLVPQYARIFDKKDALEIVLTVKLPNYTISMYDAFFLWLSGEKEALGWGYNSFSFIFKAFGSTYTPGMYLPIRTAFGDTNIYTILRPLVSDFGIMAPAAFLFIAGLCTSYLGFFRGRLLMSLFARVPVVLFFYPLYSAFYFTTTALGFALFFAVALYSGRR